MQRVSASRAQPSKSRALQEQKISTPPPPDEKKGAREKRKPRNEEIKNPVVRLVNPETGALDPPASLRVILARMNPKTHFLELVTTEPEPIVRLHDRKLLYDREKTKKRVHASKKAPEEKEVQLTWGVGAADMEFKLRKVRADLADGHRVSLIFAPKKGQVLPGPVQQEKMIADALAFLGEVGREHKERTVHKQAVAVFLESLRKKRTVDLKWVDSDGASWEGLKSIESALRGGERVEAVFILPPPPKKEKNKTPFDPHADRGVDPVLVQEKVERTLQSLAEVGREWKPRDSRKGIIVAHLEPPPPTSEAEDSST